jgi:RNA polymerase sigma factor (sigma-70 family)
MINRKSSENVININSEIPDNTHLWILYIQDKSIEKRNILVEMNLGLARKLAHQSHKKHPEICYDDIEQQSFIALIQCVETFDVSKGYKFSTFAYPVINGRLLNFIRDKNSLIKIPRKVTNIKTAYNKNLATVDEYKNAQNDIKFCKYHKELTDNDNIPYKNSQEIDDFIIKTNISIKDDSFEPINMIFKKNKILPMDFLSIRKFCMKTNIEIKNL